MVGSIKSLAWRRDPHGHYLYADLNDKERLTIVANLSGGYDLRFNGEFLNWDFSETELMAYAKTWIGDDE
jgi:hypothetical protein